MDDGERFWYKYETVCNALQLAMKRLLYYTTLRNITQAKTLYVSSYRYLECFTDTKMTITHVYFFR